MVSHADPFPTARPFLPSRLSLPQLKKAAATCRGCDLYLHATQTVFGEGPPTARVLFVGEQPGDKEDLSGHPFVGPAGRVLDEALEAVGIDRADVYVTNAVKHFKFEPRGKRRIHAKPSSRQVAACLPWLEAEVQVIRPEVASRSALPRPRRCSGRAFASPPRAVSRSPTRAGACASSPLFIRLRCFALPMRPHDERKSSCSVETWRR